VEAARAMSWVINIRESLRFLLMDFNRFITWA
jgi:hypothetical protein